MPDDLTTPAAQGELDRVVEAVTDTDGQTWDGLPPGTWDEFPAGTYDESLLRSN